MEEIVKIRVWDKRTKRMSSDYITGCSVSLNEVFKNGIKVEGDYPLVFMQYLGIKDTGNTDIFSGDIVRSFGGKYCWGWQYDKTIVAGLNLETFQDLAYTENCKVIGNIYENPELIK